MLRWFLVNHHHPRKPQLPLLESYLVKTLLAFWMRHQKKDIAARRPVLRPPWELDAPPPSRSPLARAVRDGIPVTFSAREERRLPVLVPVPVAATILSASLIWGRIRRRSDFYHPPKGGGSPRFADLQIPGTRSTPGQRHPPTRRSPERRNLGGESSSKDTPRSSACLSKNLRSVSRASPALLRQRPKDLFCGLSAWRRGSPEKDMVQVAFHGPRRLFPHRRHPCGVVSLREKKGLCCNLTCFHPSSGSPPCCDCWLSTARVPANNGTVPHTAVPADGPSLACRELMP